MTRAIVHQGDWYLHADDVMTVLTEVAIEVAQGGDTAGASTLYAMALAIGSATLHNDLAAMEAET